MTAEIDHVLLAVADLREAAAWWSSTFGLEVTIGGRHPGGTENLCIPVGGTQYLELITVFDRSNPKAADWARFIDAGGGLSSWAVKTDDLPGCAARTGSEISEGWIERTDGTRGGGWSTVGSAGAFQSHGELPFFIEYGRDNSADWAQGYAAAGHRRRPAGFAEIVVGGDAERFATWVGDASLPVRHQPGAVGLIEVSIAMLDGDPVTFPIVEKNP